MDHLQEAIAKLEETMQVKRFVWLNLGEGLEKKSVTLAAAAGSSALSEEEAGPKVVVSAVAVKQVRGATGAGMMDCKKALEAGGGDVKKGTEYVRKQGMASADERSRRSACEGMIGGNELMEVNSETDDTVRTAAFKELVADMAMQVVACPHVQYVTMDEIPSAFVEKETEIEFGREDLADHPEEMRDRIIEDRVANTLHRLVLLEQPYIKDPHHKVLVKDYVKQTIGTLGENIQVRRFVRFTLGEDI